ncbi:MAG: rRNA methyltransferase [Rhodobacterales bacterium 12-64-8]|nr:MAG: rRNA methyltransferase [Rhodobacterales bacterium 12-64-8]OYX50595.1 MAG: rRNA methyltransferase [Alphaproteobacteria bacterium 32-64-14]
MTVEEDDKGRRRWKAPLDSRGPAGGRMMAQKEKVRKKTLSKSSREWVDRQLRDPYVLRAQEEGYRARAAFKLKEIDEKFNIVKRGARVVDLGSAPGGWLQVLLEKGAIRVVGVDLLPVDPIPGITIFQADIYEPGMTDKLMAALGDKPNLVLSDMAANTVGHKQTDHVRTVGLAEVAANFAIANLAKGGNFVTKVFQGGAQKSLLDVLKANFDDVRHWKPPSSRAESPETFVIARKFKG